MLWGGAIFIDNINSDLGSKLVALDLDLFLIYIKSIDPIKYLVVQKNWGCGTLKLRSSEFVEDPMALVYFLCPNGRVTLGSTKKVKLPSLTVIEH